MIIPILIVLGVAYLGIMAGSKTRNQRMWEQTPDAQAVANLRSIGLDDESIVAFLRLRRVYGDSVLSMDKARMRVALIDSGSTQAQADKAIAQLVAYFAKQGIAVSGHRRTSAVKRLSDHIYHGLEPSKWLVSEAMAEAYDSGDWGAVSEISNMFGEPEPQAQGTPPPGEEPAASQEQPTPTKSPLDGIEDGDWRSFTEALATRDPGFATERYVGKYEQSLSRLKQLGVEPPQGEAAQASALATDMGVYWEDEAKLIQDFAGEVVEIKGGQHAVTPSGVLGLLKSAGPQGARSWLEHEGDREKFPRTTETFIRTNGCF